GQCAFAIQQPLTGRYRQFKQYSRLQVKKFILAATVGISLSIQAQLCTVDWNEVHQRIDGFGASSAFLTMTWTPSQANLFFSTNYGIGLSLLRTQIQPGGYGN